MCWKTINSLKNLLLRENKFAKNDRAPVSACKVVADAHLFSLLQNKINKFKVFA